MPKGKGFASKAQRGYMWVHHPKIAKRWQRETGKRRLPARKRK